MKQIYSFLSVLKAKYSQQGQLGKILLPGLFLFVFCCLCSVLFLLIPVGARNTSGITPSPIFLTSTGTQATPTALFGFGSTPFPTLVAPTALPTTPDLATATPIPTQTVPTPTPTVTATSIPSSTNTNPPPTVPSGDSIQIIGVDKRAEYVEIKNTGREPVDLKDWRLVSETGDQPCTLRLVLLPNEVLRVWSRKGDGGLSCGYHINIWNDDRADPAVLYDPQGKEISRYP